MHVVCRRRGDTICFGVGRAGGAAVVGCCCTTTPCQLHEVMI